MNRLRKSCPEFLSDCTLPYDSILILVCLKTDKSCVFVLIVFVLTLGCCLLALTMKIDKRRKEGRNNRLPMRQPDGNDFVG